MTDPVLVEINGRWPVWMPPHRAERPEWPWWEAIRLGHMNAHLKPGEVIFDIGAEEGDLSALYATWGLRPVLFEPNPLVWPNIRYIFERNFLDVPDWFVGFASDYTNLAPAEQPVPDLVSRLTNDTSMWPNCAFGELIGDHGFRNLSERTHDTPQITIDDFVRMNLVKPDAITIDVEGSEYRVLKGARGVLDTARPKVWVSIHPIFMDEMYGDSIHDLLIFMESVGYKDRFLATDHESHYYFEPQ